MPRHAERSPRRLAVQGLLVALGALAALPAYLAVDLSWRAAVVHGTGAVIASIGALRVLRGARRAIGGRPVSPLDVAPPAPPVPVLDAHFRRLRDDVTFSVRRRRHFDAILWPRLVTLAKATALPPPARRGIIRRRGPSLATIESLIARIETRR
jgi:hypothetical protein